MERQGLIEGSLGRRVVYFYLFLMFVGPPGLMVISGTFFGKLPSSELMFGTEDSRWSGLLPWLPFTAIGLWLCDLGFRFTHHLSPFRGWVFCAAITGWIAFAVTMEETRHDPPFPFSVWFLIGALIGIGFQMGYRKGCQDHASAPENGGVIEDREKETLLDLGKASGTSQIETSIS